MAYGWSRLLYFTLTLTSIHMLADVIKYSLPIELWHRALSISFLSWVPSFNFQGWLGFEHELCSAVKLLLQTGLVCRMWNGIVWSLIRKHIPLRVSALPGFVAAYGKEVAAYTKVHKMKPPVKLILLRVTTTRSQFDLEELIALCPSIQSLYISSPQHDSSHLRFHRLDALVYLGVNNLDVLAPCLSKFRQVFPKVRHLSFKHWPATLPVLDFGTLESLYCPSITPSSDHLDNVTAMVVGTLAFEHPAWSVDEELQEFMKRVAADINLVMINGLIDARACRDIGWVAAFQQVETVKIEGRWYTGCLHLPRSMVRVKRLVVSFVYPGKERCHSCNPGWGPPAGNGTPWPMRAFPNLQEVVYKRVYLNCNSSIESFEESQAMLFGEGKVKVEDWEYRQDVWGF